MKRKRERAKNAHTDEIFDALNTHTHTHTSKSVFRSFDHYHRIDVVVYVSIARNALNALNGKKKDRRVKCRRRRRVRTTFGNWFQCR